MFMKSKNIIFYVILIKLFLFSLFFIYGLINNSYEHKNGVFFYGKDTVSYFEPVENLIDGKGYIRNNKCSQFRQPIMLFIYGPIYSFFNKNISLQFYVVIQFLMEVLISFFIIRGILNFCNNKKFSIIVISFFPLSIFYVNYGLTEVPGAFFAIIFITFFIKFYSKMNIKYLIICSISLGFLIFSKPIFILYLILFNFLLIAKFFQSKTIFSKIILHLFLFNAFFIVLELSWLNIQKTTIQRTNENKELVLLTNAFNSKSIDALFKKFFRKNALSFQTFDGKSHHEWLIGKIHEDVFLEKDFNSFIWTKSFNYDSLMMIRKLYIKSLQPNQEVSIIHNRIKKLISYNDSRSFKSNVSRFIFSRILHFKMLFFINTSYANPFIGADFFQNLSRKILLLLYYFLIIFFFISSFLAFVDIKLLYNNWIYLLSIWVIISAFIFLGIHENRYLLPLFPLMVLSSIKIGSEFRSNLLLKT